MPGGKRKQKTEKEDLSGHTFRLRDLTISNERERHLMQKVVHRQGARRIRRKSRSRPKSLNCAHRNRLGEAIFHAGARNICLRMKVKRKEERKLDTDRCSLPPEEREESIVLKEDKGRC